MEYNSQVPVDLHRRILTLVHEDNAAALDSLLTSLVGTENEITESTLFMVHVKRNLLHIVSYNQARNCARLLVRTPYSWNPDRLDGVNRTPCHFAESRDDLGVFFELADCSCERHPWDLDIPAPVFNGNLVTVLFWPQDVVKRPLNLRAVVGPRNIGISGCFRYLEEQFVYKTHVIGPLFALLFELYMASPQLFNFNLWNGEEQGRKYSFWPIPQRVLGMTEPIQDEMHCKIYPHCLYLTALTNSERVSDPEALDLVVRVWLYHRFSCYRPPGADYLCFGAILSLKEFCRNRLRDLLVHHMVACKIETNYFKVIEQLGLPNSLEQYLLYRSLWDIDNAWETYLSNGSGGNIPCGSKVTIKRTTEDDSIQGTFIGHRFIPDH